MTYDPHDYLSQADRRAREHPTLEEIRQRAAAATPGPWYWAGNTDIQSLFLATRLPGAGRCTIMDFARWGMQRARPRFAHRERRNNAYQGGLMENGDAEVIYEVAPEAQDRDDPRVYRGDVIGIRNPDAAFIAHARQDIAFLLSLVWEQQETIERYQAAHDRMVAHDEWVRSEHFGPPEEDQDNG